ncbi:MAG: hypothetical protein OEO83_13140 [Alphaproteobacteria bacterium]|nr:hypothetical protein [Alphaproteobacteria bacterium]
MKLLRDDEVPEPPAVQSYRETQWSGLAVGAVLSAVAAALLAVPVLEGLAEAAWAYWIVGPIAASLFFIARFAIRSFVASRKPANWRLRWSTDRLHLRYRSYLNGHFAADVPTVLSLDRREVSFLKVRTETLAVSDGDGGLGARRKIRWLEIGLRRVDTKAINDALAAEYARRDGPGWHAKDNPVTLTPQGSLRVALLRPGAVIDRLRRLYAVAPAEDGAPTDFRDMDRTEQEDHVRALARAGEFMSAVIAARQVHGLDLAAAKALVESLQAGDAPARRDN